MRSTTTSAPPAGAVATPIVPSESERLQHRIDDLSQQVLQARDAVLGAEAELGVALARTAELERHVHVLEAEVVELRASAGPNGRRTRALEAGIAAGGRVTRRVGRRVVGLARSRA